ncbi:MAG TPA: SIMPL domain-containing protein [Phycisphaerae bacterium]|nr:SIMPL domain-containing protein [Phycisphaerae bacterium]
MRMAVISLVVSGFLASSSMAADQPVPHVSVFGTATKEVTPDMLRWNLRVSNKGGNLKQVAEKHAGLVSGLLRVLKEKGIKEEKLQTTDMWFGENWEYRDSSRVMDGYEATTDVTFEMTELAQYRDMWISLAGMAGVSISNVSFDVSNRIEIRNETRKSALVAARNKASEMAHALDAEIGEPLVIEEVENGFNVWAAASNAVSYDDGPSADRESTPLSRGQISVKVRVRVEFRLVSNG